MARTDQALDGADAIGKPTSQPCAAFPPNTVDLRPDPRTLRVARRGSSARLKTHDHFNPLNQHLATGVFTGATNNAAQVCNLAVV